MPREDWLDDPTEAHLEWLEIQMAMARAQYGASVDTPAFRKSVLRDMQDESEAQILAQLAEHRKHNPAPRKPRQTKGRKSNSIWPIKT